MRKLTRDEFIARSKLIHNDKYDYSKVEYVNNSTKVIITCPIHGDFEQTPAKHLKGRGCPNLECINMRREATSMAHFGVANPAQADEVKAKMAETNLRVRGVANPMQDEAVKETLRQTNQKRFGVDCTLQAPEIRAQAEATRRKKFGGNSPMCDSTVRAKQQMSMLRNYGAVHALQVPELREKARLTLDRNYHTDNPMHLLENRQKVVDSKREHQTFTTSGAEEELYHMLCEQFGAYDVFRQFSSDKYPFACDFYIKSRDLYIELNGSWTHYCCWFDENKPHVMAELAKWQEKAGFSEYYQNAIHVWTEADVKKRDTARQNALNYVVFWDTKLRDAKLWFAMSCPDGQDWAQEYSWFPVRDISQVETHKKLSDGTASVIVKTYQAAVFYHNEIAMWNENPPYDDILLQAWMYWNRYVHHDLHKLPHELSNLELLRGFAIARVTPRLSAYDTKLMDCAIQKYGIKSIYDPCAGWGERMLYCYQHDIEYYGVDINDALKPGYEAMMQDYHIQKQTIFWADSSSYQPSVHVGAVLTCPPYGNQEIYTDKGAENLNGDEFEAWWRCVVENCLCVNPEYFCIQANHKWIDTFEQVVLEFGFERVDSFEARVRADHFTKGVKTEGEVMRVLKRLR